MPDEFPIIPSKPKEAPQLFDICGLGPELDSIDFCRIGCHSRLTDNMAQVRNTLLPEAALRKLDQPLVLGQQIKNLTQVLKMISPCGTVNQYIIEKYNHTLAEKGLESGIHGSLERVGSASEAEGHNSELEMTPMGLKCRLMFFPWS
jgi:hypothetical protein